MSRTRFELIPNLTLAELVAYHEDVVESLRLYFSPTAPTFAMRFAGQPPEAARKELALRLEESDARSTLILLTSLEARFRVDFEFRCKMRLKDDLSRHFRVIDRKAGYRVRLDEDILEGWKQHTGVSATLISQLRGAFRFRHWLAHGRYWTPRIGHKYDFDFAILMATAIVSGFPFAA